MVVSTEQRVDGHQPAANTPRIRSDAVQEFVQDSSVDIARSSEQKLLRGQELMQRQRGLHHRWRQTSAIATYIIRLVDREPGSFPGSAIEFFCFQRLERLVEGEVVLDNVIALRIAASGAPSSNSVVPPCRLTPSSFQMAFRSTDVGVAFILS